MANGCQVGRTCADVDRGRPVDDHAERAVLVVVEDEDDGCARRCGSPSAGVATSRRPVSSASTSGPRARAAWSSRHERRASSGTQQDPGESATTSARSPAAARQQPVLDDLAQDGVRQQRDDQPPERTPAASPVHATAAKAAACTTLSRYGRPPSGPTGPGPVQEHHELTTTASGERRARSRQPAAAGGRHAGAGSSSTITDTPGADGRADRRSHGAGDVGVEDAGHDVAGVAARRQSTTAARARAAASSICEVDRVAVCVEQPAEDPREGQHVVDLVREVAAPGRDDGCVLRRRQRVDLGHRVGQGEHDAPSAIVAMSVAGEEVRRGDADEDVGTGQRPAQVAGDAAAVGVARRPVISSAASPSRSAWITPSLSATTTSRGACLDQHREDRHAGRARARHDDAHLADVLARRP